MYSKSAILCIISYVYLVYLNSYALLPSSFSSSFYIISVNVIFFLIYSLTFGDNSLLVYLYSWRYCISDKFEFPIASLNNKNQKNTRFYLIYLEIRHDATQMENHIILLTYISLNFYDVLSQLSYSSNNILKIKIIILYFW